MKFLIVILVMSLLSNQVAQAGPILGAAVASGCAVVVTACYAAAGFTFGTVLAATAPASILACNSAFGACMAKTAAVFAAPTP
jgi:hypothetical protein